MRGGAPKKAYAKKCGPKSSNQSLATRLEPCVANTRRPAAEAVASRSAPRVCNGKNIMHACVSNILHTAAIFSYIFLFRLLPLFFLLCFRTADMTPALVCFIFAYSALCYCFRRHLTSYAALFCIQIDAFMSQKLFQLLLIFSPFSVFSSIVPFAFSCPLCARCAFTFCILIVPICILSTFLVLTGEWKRR